MVMIVKENSLSKESNKREIKNMVMLGISFMVMFSAFNTMENLEKPFLASMREDDPSFTADGFIALSILYLMFGLFLWLAPSIISIIGPRASLVIGSMGYSVFIASFYFRKTYLIYAGSVINGMASSLLWTAQGNYAILNSRPKTITRNMSIFWMLFKCSLFSGNIFVSFKFQGKQKIDRSTGDIVIIVLFCVSMAATFLMLFLKKPEHEGQKRDETSLWASKVSFTAEAGPKEAFIRSVKLIMKPKIMILFPLFIYFGFQVALLSGIYSASVGFTKSLGEDSKKFVPLIGISVGLGEMITGFVLILKGTRISKMKWGGVYVVVTGFIVQSLCYLLSFLNLPNAAVFGDTHDTAVWPSNIYLALFCGMLIGVGDGCFCCQIYVLLETMYPNDSSQTVALFNFANALATALSFLCSTLLGLHTQLMILFSMGLVGTIGFTYVTGQVKKGFQSEAISSTIH